MFFEKISIKHGEITKCHQNMHMWGNVFVANK